MYVDDRNFAVYEKRLDNVLYILSTLDDETWAKWYGQKYLMNYTGE